MAANKILYDISKLEKLCNADPKFIDRMLQIFIRDTPLQLEKIKTGFETSDAEMIRFAAHRLKPAVQNICNTEIVDEVMLIEKEAEMGKIDDSLFQVSKNFTSHINIVIRQLTENFNLIPK